jgi:hypothetical protein
MTKEITPANLREGQRPRQGIWRQVVEVLHKEGIRSLWFKTLDKLMVYRRLFFFGRYLSESPPEATSSLPVTIDLLKKTEVDEYLNFRPEEDPSQVRRQLERGHMCFVTRHEGRMVMVAWAATGQVWFHHVIARLAWLRAWCILTTDLPPRSFAGITSPPWYQHMSNDIFEKLAINAYSPSSYQKIPHPDDILRRVTGAASG